MMPSSNDFPSAYDGGQSVTSNGTLRQYTAAEMREMAEWMDRQAENSSAAFTDKIKATAAMLRQAAEAMEKDERRKSLDELAALSQELGLYDIQTPATTKE